MATALSSSDEVAEVSSVHVKQWAAGLKHFMTCSSSMTQYMIIHQRSLYNHPPAGLLPRARILVSLANLVEDYRKSYHLSRHMDHVPNVQNHVTF